MRYLAFCLGLGLLWPAMGQASFSPFLAKNLNLHFEGDDGEAKAERLLITARDRVFDFKPLLADIKRKDGDLVIQAAGHEVALPGGEILEESKKVDLIRLNANASENRAALRVRRLRTTLRADSIWNFDGGKTGKDKTYTLDELGVACTGETTNTEEENLKYYYACIEKGETLLTGDELNIPEGENDTPTKYNNIELKIKNQKYELKAKTRKGIFGIIIKSEGTIHYSPEDNIVSWRIDKCKAAYVDLREKIFESFEGKEDSGIQVQRPYIIFDLDHQKSQDHRDGLSKALSAR